MSHDGVTPHEWWESTVGLQQIYSEPVLCFYYSKQETMGLVVSYYEDLY